MASLEQVEDYLNIETADVQLCAGKRKENKNKYYYFRNQYYIIKLSQNDKWMICDDSRQTRQLLRKHTFYCARGYGSTNIDNKIVGYHRLINNCPVGMIPDHINRKTFDNRSANIRHVQKIFNDRNRSTYKNNTSQKQGVSKCKTKGYEYWKVKISDNNNDVVTKLFSIKKYGHNVAKFKAIEERQRLEQLYGYIGE